MKPQLRSNRTNSKPSPQAAVSDSSQNVFVAAPAGLTLHWRFLSAWNSNQVIIDTRHFQATDPKPRHIDLDLITIAGAGSSGGIYKSPVPLQHFPNFISALKFAINNAVADSDKGGVGLVVGATLNSCRNMFSWMIQRGIYKLSDCQPQDVNELLSNVATRGWHRMNRVNRRLLELGLKLRTNPELARKFISKHTQANFHINHTELEREIGLPLGNDSIPLWFRRRLAKLVGGAIPIYTAVSITKKPSNFTGAVKTGRTLNRLALAPAGIDSFQFFPFHSVNAAVKNLIAQNTRQTPNIKISEAAKVLGECLRWLYDFSPHLLKVLEIARSHFERTSGCWDPTAEAYNSFVEAGVLPGPIVSASHGGMRRITETISVCMTSAGCIVGIFHARRANEIFGHDKPYGAYFGCVEKISSIPLAFQAEFYVEKGPQDFRYFPANALIADAIALLERFFVLFRDINEPETYYTNPRSLSRNKKLFQIRSIQRHKFSDSWFCPEWRLSINTILTRSGVDAKVWWKQHTPFRRLYATFFIHRYDMPELPALQHQLGQWGVAQAISYAYDKVEHPEGRAIREIHSRERDFDAQSIRQEIRKASREYLVELIEGLLKGKTTGGVFPLLLLKLAKRLSASTDFRKLSAERKAERLAAVASKRGYAANPLSHAVCMAGTARSTRARANCAEQGELHREKASSDMCNACVHSWSNANYHRNQRAQADKLDDDAQRYDLPATLKNSMREQADKLREIVLIEEGFSARTAEALEALAKLWADHVGGEMDS